MGLFDGIGEAKASMAANYDRDGDYIAVINRVKAIDTRKNGPAIVIEKTIIHVYDDGEGKGHVVGEDVTHMMQKKFDSFLGNFKAFVMGATGCSEDEVNDETCDQIVNEELNPLGGTVVRTTNNTIITREKKLPFTVVNYKGEVKPSKLADILDDTTIERFFGDGKFEAMIEAEVEASVED